MNPLIDKLNSLADMGIPVGFCPWLDGEGVLWGRLLEITEDKYRVQEMDVFGKDDEIDEYTFEETLYFDVNEAYANRLLLLRDFTPTLPDETIPITDSNDISNAFVEAFATGEVIRISFPGSRDQDVTVGLNGNGWAEITYYTDLMKPKGSQWVRIDQVTEVNWRSASREADGYLLNLS